MIGLLAMGIVLVYRSTRVINFAVGNMGLVGASLLALLVVELRRPVLARGDRRAGRRHALRRDHGADRHPAALLRAARHRARRDDRDRRARARDRHRVSGARPTSARRTRSPIDNDLDDVVGVRVTGAQLAVLVVVPIVAVALGWFLNRTLARPHGQGVGREPRPRAGAGHQPQDRLDRGVVDRRLRGHAHDDPGGRPTTAAPPTTCSSLGPNTLVRALAAAVIAGMVSFPRAMLAGVAIGVVQALVNFNYLDKPGLIDGCSCWSRCSIAVALQSRGRGPAETQTFSFAPKVREIPEQLRDVWWVRRLNVLVLGACSCVVAVARAAASSPRRRASCSTRRSAASRSAACRSPCSPDGRASSRSGQMAFAGFGALLAAALTRGLHFDLGVVTLDFAGLPFVALHPASRRSLTAGLAVLIGVGALRVRGSAARGQHLRVRGRRVAVPLPPAGAVRRPDVAGARSLAARCSALDLSSQRTYYYVLSWPCS